METKAKRRSPKGTGYVNSLYTVPGVPLDQAQFVEKEFLRLVEDWASRALKLFLSNTTFPKATIDRRLQVGWARFLYSMIVRTPELIKTIQKRADENPPELPETLRQDYEKLRGPDD